jgi:hypothetical protein
MMVFSLRNKPAPSRLTTELSEQARLRIYHTIPDLILNSYLYDLFDEMAPRLLRLYGELAHRDSVYVDRSTHLVAGHFRYCNNERALDFIELIFQSRYYRAGQAGVEMINAIFRQEGIGYELTPWREVEVGEGRLFGRSTRGPAIRIEYPTIRTRGEEALEEAVVRPALQVLADPRFATANAEMLKAHQHHRKGEDADAITACGCAFESVLKTICSIKGWRYDADKDACAALVKACRDNGLFPPFYAPIFEATGTIRNKLGDAHGKGPTPLYTVTKEHVEHAIQVTSAHIVLLVNLAQL